VVDGAIENLEDDNNLVTVSSNDLGRWLILYSLTNYFPRILISMIPRCFDFVPSNIASNFPQYMRIVSIVSLGSQSSTQRSLLGLFLAVFAVLFTRELYSWDSNNQTPLIVMLSNCERRATRRLFVPICHLMKADESVAPKFHANWLKLV